MHEGTGSKGGAAGGTFSKASFKAGRGVGGDGKGGSAGGEVGGAGAEDDVDIDDPDFWKKMVGDDRIAEDEDAAALAALAGKKRRRNRANYSEKDYERRLMKQIKGGEDDFHPNQSSDDGGEDYDAAADDGNSSGEDDGGEGGGGEADAGKDVGKDVGKDAGKDVGKGGETGTDAAVGADVVNISDDSDSGDESVSSASDMEFDLSNEGEGEGAALWNETLRSLGDDKKRRRRVRERNRWGSGGGGRGGASSATLVSAETVPANWKKEDAESVLGCLRAHGYGNLPMDEFRRRCFGSRSGGSGKDKGIDREGGSMDRKKGRGWSILRLANADEEIRRMAWALALTTLTEAVEDDVKSMARRAEKKAAEVKRKKEENGGSGVGEEKGASSSSGSAAGEQVKTTAMTPTMTPSNSDGGVLGKLHLSDADRCDEIESLAQRVRSFDKVWQTNASWARIALKDALSYAQERRPRDQAIIERALAGGGGVDGIEGKGLASANKRKKGVTSSTLTAAFDENIWPALRSRGWKDETAPDGRRRFVFGKTTVSCRDLKMANWGLSVAYVDTYLDV